MICIISMGKAREASKGPIADAIGPLLIRYNGSSILSLISDSARTPKGLLFRSAVAAATEHDDNRKYDHPCAVIIEEMA